MSERTRVLTDPGDPTAEHASVDTIGFVLSRPYGTVVARRMRRTFDAVASAVEALRSGAAPAMVGAIPFAREHPSALSVPESLTMTAAGWAPTVSPKRMPEWAISGSDASEHLERVATVVRLLRQQTGPLMKVVLARRMTLRSEVALAPLDLLSALVERTPTGDGYYVDLSAAGGAFVGTSLVGSSPEVLIRRRGSRVTCHPLAGSAPRHADPRTDRRNGGDLLESTKDLREHAFVVDAIRTALEPFCSSLTVPDAPSLTHTPQLWHLGTPMEGVLRHSSTTSLELAVALHPTPAVCGTPTDLAYEVIDRLEGDRAFYGGAVGWCDAHGDGDWMVSIRCAQIGADGRRVTAYAGGGIVAESDPESELRETDTKFGTVLEALGVRRS
ncbi:isochorismate synthase [Millisia brevis]|uniref:isochorismate synthase n=1 Tax=Millisia brevis TaxID=264148 RepID=UPI0009FC65B3|nr:isochorismate synthase [Millisia brevis]